MFIELTNRSGRSSKTKISINVREICSVEDNDDHSDIFVGRWLINVEETHDQVMKLIRDAKGE